MGQVYYFPQPPGEQLLELETEMALHPERFFFRCRGMYKYVCRNRTPQVGDWVLLRAHYECDYAVIRKWSGDIASVKLDSGSTICVPAGDIRAVIAQIRMQPTLAA
jgi:hypothetical protein